MTRVNKRNETCEEMKSGSEPYLKGVEHGREREMQIIKRKETEIKHRNPDQMDQTRSLMLPKSIRGIRPSVLPFAFTVLSLSVRPFPWNLRFINIWIIVFRWRRGRGHRSTSSSSRSSLPRPPSA